MAIEAELVGGFAQLRGVVRSVDVVAGGAGYAVTVHDALYKIVALHPVFVSRAIGEVQEVSLSEHHVIELPKVR